MLNDPHVEGIEMKLCGVIAATLLVGCISADEIELDNRSKQMAYDAIRVHPAVCVPATVLPFRRQGVTFDVPLYKCWDELHTETSLAQKYRQQLEQQNGITSTAAQAQPNQN